MRKFLKAALLVGAVAAGQLAMAPVASAEPAAAAASMAAAEITCDSTRYTDGAEVYCRGSGASEFRLYLVCKSRHDQTSFVTHGPWRRVGGGVPSAARCGSDYRVNAIRYQLR